MRNEVIVVAVLAAGGASAVAVSACGSSDSKDKSAKSTAATTATTAPARPLPPATLAVRIAGRTRMLKVADISLSYCRGHARTCAAIKSSQQAQLTPSQRKAIKAAVLQVRAQEEAAQRPVPPQAPTPEPAPEPQPQSGGETTTG